MTYIGIDPGKKGGIAVLEEREGGEKKISAYPYTDDTLKSVCSSQIVNSCFCIVEKVSAMPKQGVTSTFHFGQSFGYILGVLEANEIPYQLVTPKTWKKHYGLNDDKGKSIETAKRLFPSVSLLPTDRCRAESDGMAEALLMALYAMRVDRGGSGESAKVMDCPSMEQVADYLIKHGVTVKGYEYFSPQQVRNMSPREIHENYTAIMRSMKEWK